MKNEPTDNPWPYDHRPMADQGRDIYHQNKDGQGSLVALPGREREPSDYERLKSALYENAEHIDMMFGSFLLEFFESIEHPDLAHAIREGVHDASKSTAKREEGEADKWSAVNPEWVNNPEWVKSFSETFIARREAELGRVFFGVDYAKDKDRTAYFQWPRKSGKTDAALRSREYGVAPSPDHTPSGGFSEEEIAFVRRDKPTHCTFSEMEQSYRSLTRFHGANAKLAGHFICRLASIAQHLADMGE